LKDACDAMGYDVRNLFNASLVDAAGVSPFNVVTFVSNHDMRASSQYINNDPILAYAYILTNNQIGIPTVFYPDYYYVPGFPNTGMINQINKLMQVHKDYIFGATARDYLTRFSSPYWESFNNGNNLWSTTIVSQIMQTPSGRDVITAINFAGLPLDVTVGINMSNSSLHDGVTFSDKIGNALDNYATLSGGKLQLRLPARSYSVWVQDKQPLVLTLTALIEAMYIAGGNSMSMAPFVTVELHDATTLALVESKTGTLNTAGLGTFTFTLANNGTSYYIVIKSPNTIETWSASTVSFTSGALSYDFTTGLNKAYTDGSNPSLVQHNGKFCIYTGDVNQDGFITTDDYTRIDNDAGNFDYHISTDVNGDGFITTDDYTSIDNNGAAFVQKQVPPAFPVNSGFNETKIKLNYNFGELLRSTY
jgi:hypothetical protein